MKDKSNQFISSYSGDLFFLKSLKEAYYTHPLSDGDVVINMLNSHSTRILSILIVGNIEAIINKWKNEKVDFENLEELLKTGTIAEIERKANLIINLFDNSKIKVNQSIILEYLGIKNLRNAIIHSKVDKNKEEIFNRFNFSADVNYLCEYDRLMDVNNEMMKYINEYALKKLNILPKYINILIQEKVSSIFFDHFEHVKNRKKDNNDDVLLRIIQPYNDDTHLPYALDKSNISQVLFGNLERIYLELQGKDRNDYKSINNLAESAEYCWKEYMNIRFMNYDTLDISDINNAIHIIQILIKDDLEKLENVSFLESINLAGKIHRIIINYSVIELYITLLKYLQKDNRRRIFKELKKIIALCELKEYYIAYQKKTSYPSEFFNKIEIAVEEIIKNSRF